MKSSNNMELLGLAGQKSEPLAVLNSKSTKSISPSRFKKCLLKSTIGKISKDVTINSNKELIINSGNVLNISSARDDKQKPQPKLKSMTRLRQNFEQHVKHQRVIDQACIKDQV